MSVVINDPLTEPSPMREIVRLARSECLSLLRTHRIGQIVWLDRAGQRVCPVIYTHPHHGLEVPVAADGPFVQLRASDRVLLEIDDLDSETGIGWCVTVTGRIRPHGPRSVMITIDRCRGSYLGLMGTEDEPAIDPYD